MPDQEDTMSKHLLVPLDGSPLADAAMLPAAEIARRLGLDVVLVRVHVPIGLPSYPSEFPIYLPDPALEARVRSDADAWLRKRAADLAHATSLPVSAALCVGDPAEEIVAEATRQRAQLIVCGTHGVGGLAPHWIGSVADAVVRHAPCPVLVLPSGAVSRSDALRNVLVLLDGSNVSDAILPHAAWLAGAFTAELELLSVVAPPWTNDSLATLTAGDEDAFGIDAHATAAKEHLDRIAADLRNAGLRVRTSVVVDATPTRRILEHIAHANPDAVALATHGRGFSRLFLGSVADKVLRSCGRPVLLLRPARESPEGSPPEPRRARGEHRPEPRGDRLAKHA